MFKITTTKEVINELPPRYVRLVLTDDESHYHCLVETEGGTLEYRIGVGTKKEMTARRFISLIRSIVQLVKQPQLEQVAIELADLEFKGLPYDEAWVISTVVENISLAAYEFNKYKSKNDNKTKTLKEVLICGNLNAKKKAAFERGLVVAEHVNLARDIANTTAADMTPTALGEAAVKAARGSLTKVTVLGEAEIKKLKMGALYAVGQGSENETKLIVIEYYGAGKPSRAKAKGKPARVSSRQQPLILVGKGITYDSGGLNIKPSGYMHDMHLDMSGGSSVIAAVAAAAKLKLKKNIIGIVPAAENAVSDRAMRAGDILTSLSGKTIEVLHTDAEGRLVLADALTYAAKFNPKVVIDVATLTGAALVALGQHASAIMTKDEKLRQKLEALGEESGDYVWPLPLWDEYKEYIKSARADVANIMPTFSKFGGTIEGGVFLSHFAPDCPWAHIDIAPRMDAILADKLAKGSTGEPVRLLVKFLEKY